MPLVETYLCTYCGDCVSACRRNALFLPPGQSPILLGECNGCKACINVCPTGALTTGWLPVGETFRTGSGKLTLYSGVLQPGQIFSLIRVEFLDAPSAYPWKRITPRVLKISFLYRRITLKIRGDLESLYLKTVKECVSLMEEECKHEQEQIRVALAMGEKIDHLVAGTAEGEAIIKNLARDIFVT